MADDERHGGAVERMDQIRQAFERAENAGDSSVVDERCAEDVVAVPPGQSPAVGRGAAKRALEELFAAFEVEVEYTRVSGRGRGAGVRSAHSNRNAHPERGEGDSVERSGDSPRVYRRSPDGEWKRMRATWNYGE